MRTLFVVLLAISLLAFFRSVGFSVDESLILYFDFDQGPGGTVTDKSQYGNNGKVVGNIQWVDSMNRYGKCISLPGGGPCIKVADSKSLYPGKALTVEAWVRPEEFGDPARVVVSHWFSNTGLPAAKPHLAWVLEADGAGKFRAILNWGGGRADSRGTLKLNSWQHTAFTWDGADITLYLDGVETGKAAFSGPLWDSEEALQVARTDRDDLTWKGQLDEIKVWNRALNDSEIQKSMEPFAVKPLDKLVTVWGRLKAL